MRQPPQSRSTVSRDGVEHAVSQAMCEDDNGTMTTTTTTTTMEPGGVDAQAGNQMTPEADVKLSALWSPQELFDILWDSLERYLQSEQLGSITIYLKGRCLAYAPEEVQKNMKITRPVTVQKPKFTPAFSSASNDGSAAAAAGGDSSSAAPLRNKRKATRLQRLELNLHGNAVEAASTLGVGGADHSESLSTNDCEPVKKKLKSVVIVPERPSSPLPRQ